MSSSKVNIKVFSDSDDISSVISSVKQLELKDYNISYQRAYRFVINANDIIIIQVDSIESKLINKVLEVRNDVKNKFIFVTGENVLLLSSLAKLGFIDLFVFPFELYKFVSYLEEIISNNSYITDSSSDYSNIKDFNFDYLIGESPEFLRAVALAKKVTNREDISIMVLGETGTGKGMLAKAIHNNSPSAEFPFVDIVCTSIPDTLLESELFGYEPGAFTNAKNRKFGLFELAEKGTLFLDEIGDLSMNLQTKLLRTIEKKVIRRLGGLHDIPINARIISATNHNLEELIEQNLFRRDLFHRLNVITIELPPLRHRGQDGLLITENLIKDFNKQFNKNIKRMDREAEEFILSYSWPGNVRELRNSIERAVLLSEDSVLRLKDFSNHIADKKASVTKSSGEEKLLPQFIRLDLNYHDTDLRKLDELYAKEVLEKTSGNKSKAAKLLGISRPKLDSLL